MLSKWQAQENPSPPKKTAPAWGGAGLTPVLVPSEKKDGSAWADECDEDDKEVGRPRSVSIGSAPSAKDLSMGERPLSGDTDPSSRAGEARDRQVHGRAGGGPKSN